MRKSALRGGLELEAKASLRRPQKRGGGELPRSDGQAGQAMRRIGLRFGKNAGKAERGEVTEGRKKVGSLYEGPGWEEAMRAGGRAGGRAGMRAESEGRETLEGCRDW